MKSVHVPVNIAALKNRLCLIAFILGVLFKFWLVWGTEIADATDDPHEYVLQILFPINGGLTYPPGTGLVGRFFYDLGIPFRLGMETVFLLASVLVLRALLAWPWKSWLSLGLFFLVIFDPAPGELFSHLYSDQVWLVETMLGLSCFALAFRNEDKLDWACTLLALFFFGLSIITRSVTVPLLLSAILFALFALALTLSKYRSKKLKRNLDLWALAIPTLILGICLIYGGVCRYNFLRHGYSGISYIDSAEYKNFYLCLQSVGDPTGDVYFPIDENRRQLIAQAGPDAKWFIGQLDENTVYKQIGLEHYGKYDIPAGWFHWAAFTATVHDGDYLTAFALFRSIEAEIAESSRLGHIKVRPIDPLPDSRTSLVIAAFPRSLRATCGKIVREPSPDSFAWKDGAYVDPDFTKALTRRTVTESPLRENVWRFLAVLYSWIYTPTTLFLYGIALLVFLAAPVLRWNRIEVVPPSFVARQFFTILFVVVIFWYALFDASGMPATSRYMIFNHVLLLPLIGYYLSAAARLLRTSIL